LPSKYLPPFSTFIKKSPEELVIYYQLPANP